MARRRNGPGRSATGARRQLADLRRRGRAQWRRLAGRWPRLADEADALALLLPFAAWYLSNLEGALSVDEIIYARSGYGVFQGNPYLNPTHAIAPTAKYVTGLSQALFGQSSFAVRLPAALFGLATLYVTYRLGRHLRGRWLGLTAAALVGLTYMFANHSVRMMLDVPLAFFFTASVLVGFVWLDRRAERQDDGEAAGGAARLGYLAGGLLAATATTKIYGPLYAGTVLAVLTAGIVRSEWRRAERRWAERRQASDVRTSNRWAGNRWTSDGWAVARASLRALRPPLVGGVAVIAVVYAPFAVFEHPPVDGSYSPAVHRALSIPVLGNYAYVLGQAVAANVLHLGRGHAVVVADTVFQRPPAWTYLYWLFERGGAVYAGCLALSALSVLAVPVVVRWRGARRIEWTTPLRLGVLVLAPLAGLSLLTVKFPRYVLPLYPLIVVAGLYDAGWLLDAAPDWSRRLSARSLSAERVRAVGFLVLLLAILLASASVPTSPVGGSFDASIREDAAYDDVATVVERYAEASPERVTVMTYTPTGLRYYVDDDADVAIENLRAEDTAEEIRAEKLERIRSGDIDLVVTFRNSPLLRGTTLQREIESSGRAVATVTNAPEGSEVVVYEI